MTNIEFNELSKKLFNKLIPILSSHKGLSIFARERSKFEGWLKVEVVNILSEFTDIQKIFPEKEWVDISFEDWLIELKIINTNFVKGLPVNQEKRENGQLLKSRPMTKNIDEIVNDINQLKTKKCKNKAILFIVFPIKEDEPKWQKYYERFASKLRELKIESFYFKGNVPGKIYLGII